MLAGNINEGNCVTSLAFCASRVRVYAAVWTAWLVANCVKRPFLPNKDRN